MRSIIVCIAKDEDFYLKEWVDYHLKLGFDHIFLYQNDWRYIPKQPEVTKLIIDGPHKQLACYNHYLSRNKANGDWAAFIDIDEFIVLKEHRNINQFLEEHDYPCISINSALFGSNGHDKVIGEDYKVIDRFIRRGHSITTTFKTIVQTSCVADAMTVHYPIDTPIFNTSGHFIINNSSRVPKSNDIIQLNHYFCKSKEEYQIKMARGRADLPIARTWDDFYIHDRNDIEDLSAFNFKYQ